MANKRKIIYKDGGDNGIHIPGVKDYIISAKNLDLFKYIARAPVEALYVFTNSNELTPENVEGIGLIVDEELLGGESRDPITWKFYRDLRDNAGKDTYSIELKDINYNGKKCFAIELTSGALPPNNEDESIIFEKKNKR